MSEKIKHLKIMQDKQKASIEKYEIDMLGKSKGNYSDFDEDLTVDIEIKVEFAFRSLFQWK